jgi:hypothetical protein
VRPVRAAHPLRAKATRQLRRVALVVALHLHQPMLDVLAAASRSEQRTALSDPFGVDQLAALHSAI